MRDIHARTHLERDASFRDFGDQLGIFKDAHAVAETFGVQGVQRAANTRRAGLFASVRHRVQAVVDRFEEQRRVRFGRIAMFWPAQAKADHASVAIAHRERQGLLGQLVRSAGASGRGSSDSARRSRTRLAETLRGWRRWACPSHPDAARGRRA